MIKPFFAGKTVVNSSARVFNWRCAPAGMRPARAILCPELKPLLPIWLLVFVVLATGGIFAANATSIQSAGKTFFSVKAGAASFPTDIAKIDQGFLVTPTVTLQAPKLQSISASHQAPQCTLTCLITDAPGRAPPGASPLLNNMVSNH